MERQNAIAKALYLLQQAKDILEEQMIVQDVTSLTLVDAKRHNDTTMLTLKKILQ